MFPGFLLWEVWKEINRRNFQVKRSNVQTILSSVVAHIQETFKVTKWDEKDWDMGDQEVRIIVESGLNKAYQGWVRGKTRMGL